jgi:hypothetical protein
MCTGGDQVPGSAAEALRMASTGLDYLNGPAAEQLGTAACGEALAALGVISAKHAAARAGLLRVFDAGSGHDADGYATAAAWLAARTRMTRRDAKAAVRQMRVLSDHRHLAGALAAGQVSQSWAGEIAGWTKNLPAALREETDKILLEAAGAGAGLADLAVLATAADERWKSRQPDPDEPDDRFGNRFVQLSTTFGNAGHLRGNLTPECEAALQAVLEALGKKRGKEDTRTAGERFHDALQEGCELLIRAKMVPDRAGADTRVDVHVALSQLRDLPGAPVLEEAWLAARAGEHGYLAGPDAQAIACDALIIPVVTGSPDWAVIGQMISLVLSAAYGHGHGRPGGNRQHGDGAHGQHGDSDSDGDSGSGRAALPLSLPPEAWEALQYALAKLAIDFVSGPGALASVLRTGLLGAPFNGRSVPIDVGYSQSIPEPIRRAVILRDKKCAWPGGCDRRPAQCDVHHIQHKKDGGPTSVTDCILLCQYHHDVCIHRWGWEIELLPGGSVRACGPRGQILRSHGPPPVQAA